MQCLPSWDANAGSPLMLAGLPSWGPSPWWLAVHTLVWFFPFRFFWGGGNLRGKSSWFVSCSLLRQDTKLCWKPCFLGAIPQSYLKGCLPGRGPQFGSNKILFLLLIIFADRCFCLALLSNQYHLPIFLFLFSFAQIPKMNAQQRESLGNVHTNVHAFC